MIVKVETLIKNVQLREVFKTSLRSVSEFPIFQVKIIDEKENFGVGECVATPAIVGDNFEEFSKIFEEQVRKLVLSNKFEAIQNLEIWPSLKSAVDCAYTQLQGGQKSVSVSTDVTVPIAENEDLGEIVRDRIESGFSTLKVKLGQAGARENLEKMVIIREESQGMASLRIDPNQAWTVAETLEFIELLSTSEIPVEYIEQPLPAYDITGMKSIKSNSPFEIMADESCFTIDDAKRLIDEEACDYINIKLLKSGGVTRAQLIAQECLRSGMKISVGSMMESEEGVRASINFAHSVAPDVTHDLDAAWWIKDGELKYINGKVFS